ncbi:late competence protein ComER [Alkalicoccobacillus porphyridii]|uniref:Pyrroline-5-carboxylate reductase n=1 Tax=Alkalicoccobacillus porphyridii TaxID=2597270 RepID=A0A553ZZC1_9BACI|nr:late competence protein ComER [Alkalicoccobacillus porphyridii]TSB46787.1 late competence protein ComER [Alkalicoccobacillus porphyridii]
MTQIGIIGTGSMGRMLVEAFIESNAVEEHQLTVFNRSKEKVFLLKEAFPRIKTALSAKELAQHTEIVFVCVKPFQIPDLLQEIKGNVDSDTLLVSITSPVKIESIEDQVPCKVARAIPSLINQTLSGPTLLSLGERCSPKDKEQLTTLLSFISQPLEIKEEITRVSSDIASCGPAFFSYLTQCFIDAAVRQTAISEAEATELATNMLIGLGKLFEQNRFTLTTLQERICVPGGITGEGIEVLRNETGAMFDHLFLATHRKFNNEQKHIEESFYNQGRLS